MICPLCHAEYREGFTRCADCGAELIFSLAKESNEKSSPQQIVTEFLVPLWRGEDSAVYEQIKESLSAEGISFSEIQSEEFQAPHVSPFPPIPYPNFGFEIRVMPSQLVSAGIILDRILNQEPEELELAHAEPQSEAFAEEETREIPVEWKPAEATIDVWIGVDGTMAQFIANTLRENGILSRTLVDDTDQHVLLVVPGAESRAREILREITDGTPPA